METKKTNAPNDLSDKDLVYFTGFYLKNKYHVFALNTYFRLNILNPVIDGYLTLRNKDSFAYLTASDPSGNILYPCENKRRNKRLKKDLVDYEVLEGEWNGDEFRCPPFAGYFVPGIDQERAMQLALKYEQMAFVYGEKGQPAKIVFRPLINRIYREIVIMESLNRRSGVSPARSKYIKNLGSSPVICTRVFAKNPEKGMESRV